MAKDDYLVIVYKILEYLYKCLKSGVPSSIEALEFFRLNTLQISEYYWHNIWLELIENGYIKGAVIVNTLGNPEQIKLTDKLCISMKGVEYLTENSTMQKVKNAAMEIAGIAINRI